MPRCGAIRQVSKACVVGIGKSCAGCKCRMRTTSAITGEKGDWKTSKSKFAVTGVHRPAMSPMSWPVLTNASTACFSAWMRRSLGSRSHRRPAQCRAPHLCLGALRMGADTPLRQRKRSHRPPPHQRHRPPLRPAALRASSPTPQSWLRTRRRSLHARRPSPINSLLPPHAQRHPLRQSLALSSFPTPISYFGPSKNFVERMRVFLFENSVYRRAGRARRAPPTAVGRGSLRHQPLQRNHGADRPQHRALRPRRHRIRH